MPCNKDSGYITARITSESSTAPASESSTAPSLGVHHFKALDERIFDYRHSSPCWKGGPASGLHWPLFPDNWPLSSSEEASCQHMIRAMTQTKYQPCSQGLSCPDILHAGLHLAPSGSTMPTFTQGRQGKQLMVWHTNFTNGCQEGT